MFSTILMSFSCQKEAEKMTAIYLFPKKMDEVSGISYSQKLDLLWVIEDSGNKNEIYGIDMKGNVINTVTIKKVKNVDWEDITKDKDGNLYIGDFGNNNNSRTDLCIYKIAKDSLGNKETDIVYKVSFAYPEQNDFPPQKNELLYDVESFFEFNNHFYLFTKNRSKGFDGTTLLYKIPNKPGFHDAKLMGEFKTCNDYDTCVITSAAISSDDSKVVLLSHSKLWLFENFKNDNFFSGTVSELDLKHYSQKEGVCFKDNKTVFISDERVHKIGGAVYEVSIDKLKSKP